MVNSQFKNNIKISGHYFLDGGLPAYKSYVDKNLEKIKWREKEDE